MSFCIQICQIHVFKSWIPCTGALSQVVKILNGLFYCFEKSISADTIWEGVPSSSSWSTKRTSSSTLNQRYSHLNRDCDIIVLNQRYSYLNRDCDIIVLNQRYSHLNRDCDTFVLNQRYSYLNRDVLNAIPHLVLIEILNDEN